MNFSYTDADYLRAQEDGHVRGDCSEHEEKCPSSFFMVCYILKLLSLIKKNIKYKLIKNCKICQQMLEIGDLLLILSCKIFNI